MKILKTFNIPITLELNYNQEQEAITALNLHHFNDKECNVKNKETGGFKSKYPELETPEVVSTYYNIRRSYINTVKVNLMDDGTLKLQ